jgi:RND superfamily putative drug exporter
MLAMSTLFLVDLNGIRSLALRVVVVVAFAVIASTLVLPAVLYLLGDRILKGALWRRSSDGRWHRMAERIMPVGFLSLSVVVLLALAALAVIYLMLLITFRSALLPVKAILMNLLSLGPPTACSR